MPLVVILPCPQLNILKVQKGHQAKPNLGHNHYWCNIVLEVGKIVYHCIGSRKKVQDTIILIKVVRFCVYVWMSVRPSLH